MKCPMRTWPLQLNWWKLATLVLSFCTACIVAVGKKDSSAVTGITKVSILLCCHSISCSHTCSIVLSIAEVSGLFVANKDNFLKYEYNNEVSSHKEMLRTFCFYPEAHTTALISLLTVKCGIGAVFTPCHHKSSSISAGTNY